MEFEKSTFASSLPLLRQQCLKPPSMRSENICFLIVSFPSNLAIKDDESYQSLFKPIIGKLHQVPSSKSAHLIHSFSRASFWYNCWGVKPSEIVRICKIFSKSRSSRMQDFLLLFLAQFSMRIMYYSGESCLLSTIMLLWFQ
nr:hypothetical protein CFP56_65681 [Quercus suber]